MLCWYALSVLEFITTSSLLGAIISCLLLCKANYHGQSVAIPGILTVAGLVSSDAQQ